MLPSGSHDEFLKLCARSASGQLSEEEQRRLSEHLVACPACREALRQYGAVVDRALPAIGAAGPEAEAAAGEPGPSWSEAAAEQSFFERLAQEEKPGCGGEPMHALPAAFRRVLPIAPEATWHHVWMLYAAGILLFITLAFSAYRFGMRRGTDVTQSVPPARLQGQSLPGASSLEEQLSDAAHEREIARAQIARRDQALADLRRQLELQSAEIHRMKQAQDQMEASVRSGQTDEQDLVQQRGDLAQKLAAAQSESQLLESKLDAASKESGEEAAHARALGARVDDLTRLLQDREASLNQQDQLLAHDRDIRELMGARDLYIAEVYDVADNGATRKPYGRVFYTKGKSLVFYAYDLDQEGARSTPAFQAWGRRGRTASTP